MQILLFAVFVGSLVFAVGKTIVDWSEAPEVGTEDPLVGQPAPAFALRRLSDDVDVRLEDLRGRVVLLDFWATFCGPCARTMPHLQQLASRMPPDRFAFVSINVDQPSADRTDLVNAFMREHALTFDVLIDNGRTAWDYKAMRIPRVVLIGHDGVVRFVFQGATESEFVDRAVEQMVAALAEGSGS
jgi:thiol-disulfide isomerase/thioredoxin